MITTIEEALNIITLNRDFIKKIYIGDTLVYQQFLSNIKMSILDSCTLSEMDNIPLGDTFYQISLRNASLSELDNLSLRQINGSIL